jgi:hypothetical protein
VSSEFLTPVRLEPVGFDQWRVHGEVLVRSDLLREAGFGEILEIEDRFICDLDSIPRWVPVLYALLKGRAVKEAVPHDKVYRSSGIPRALGDRLMYELMVSEKKERWVRNSIYGGLRAFGWTAYRRKNPDEQPEGANHEEADSPVDHSPGA